MKLQRKRANLAFAALVLGALIVGTQAAGADSDPCEVMGEALVLCGGSTVESPESDRSKPISPDLSVPPGSLPDAATSVVLTPSASQEEGSAPPPGTVFPFPSTQTHQDPQVVRSVYLGNNRCRYFGTAYSDGDFEGNSNFGADDSLGAYSRATATVPFFGGSSQSWAWARVGWQVRLPDNWPQPSDITVTFPWHTQGLLDVNMDEGADGFVEHRTELQLWRGGELVSDAKKRNAFWILDGGSRRVAVDRDGPENFRDIFSPGGFTYSYLMADLSNAFVDGGLIAKGRSTSQFFADDLHSWLDHITVHYDLPDGWEITNCA